jgi:hypothetical protein
MSKCIFCGDSSFGIPNKTALEQIHKLWRNIRITGEFSPNRLNDIAPGVAGD